MKYPKQWKITNWTPLHKKDSIYKRENYRPISLCNNLGKLLDKIVFQTLYHFLESNNLLNIIMALKGNLVVNIICLCYYIIFMKI